MGLSAAVISAVRDELGERIIGARLDKITQPQRDLLIFSLRGKDIDNLRLLISVNIQNMRVHLTDYAFENPAAPPMFCMLLRKHLTGAKIEAISQPPGERIMEFTLKTSTAMKDMASLRLVVELFGRIANVILVQSDGIIIDCLRRVGGDMGSAAPAGRRMILPGLRYRYPEPINAGASEKAKDTASDGGGSISASLDEAYTRKEREANNRHLGAELGRLMKTAQKRIARRLEAQREELRQTEGRDVLRQCGDLIMANLHRMKKGDKTLVAEDFYAAQTTRTASAADDEQSADVSAAPTREIRLDPLKTPQQNAAKYYKDYTKAKNAIEHLEKQIKKGEAELEYIGSVLEQIERAGGERELDEIREELKQTQYIRLKQAQGRKKPKAPETKPLRFVSKSGIQILVGKNNIQNDKLTFKTASRFDIWLHAQKIHGAHVIIKNNGVTPDDETLEMAASVAAYYSASRGDGRVPVDYTLVKHVKKPSGARPGMVIYTDYKTIVAEPREFEISN